MSNSQEQSLNENVVFLPLDESSPQFLHSEKERVAVENLLCSGPESFYNTIGPELLGCFLSPGELSQIGSWAQNYRLQKTLLGDQNQCEGSFDSDSFCSTYDPYYIDVPVPSLALGWPEKTPVVLESSVTVHSSPSPEGQPQVREVIRRNLQAAKHVIAIVTDQLTDNTIVFDLHNAASRCVAVYIILNQRSLQESFTLKRLRHPNIRVRFVGGKTFCSRTGKMVVGEMKTNFILVDLETVIHGSYSLTWTDAHLHRQLITVLRGPVVNMFDQEFRILFANSNPVSDMWGATAGSPISNPHLAKDFSRLRLQTQQSAESEFTNPPSPPADILLDWEAMGVVHKKSSQPASLLELHKEKPVEKTPQLGLNKETPTWDRLVHNEHHDENGRRTYENTSQVTAGLTDKTKNIHNTEVLSTNLPTTEGINRHDRTIERRKSRDLSVENQPNEQEMPVGRIDVQPESTNIIYKRRSISRMNSFAEEENKTDYVNSSKPIEKRPLILRVPQNPSFSSVNDIMKRLKEGTPGILRKRVNNTLSDRTRSMMDLSDFNDTENPAPRFLSNLDPDHMTPALVLMKKRNDEVKSSLKRHPAIFTPTERPRSSTLQSRVYIKKKPSDEEEPIS